ncbi:MAG: protein NnrT [Proteobacteria bacterium]|nr:protein NnrT [Pseudomonadota bacterium]
MTRFLTALTLIALTGPVFAASYDRPIPQAQSATAELWFFLASVTLLAALLAVGWLVARK